MGLAYYAAKENDKAVKHLQLVRKKDKTAVDAINTLAWILINENMDIAKGISLALEGLKISSLPELMDTLGWGYYHAVDMENALKWLKKSLMKADRKNTKIIREHLEIAQNPKHLSDLTVKFDFKNKDMENYIEAGETSEIRLAIENKGKGTAYDVKVAISQDNKEIFFMNGTKKELSPAIPLGHVLPGKTETVSILISAGILIEDGFSNISIITKEKYGNNARDLRVEVPVRHIEKPVLSFLSSLAPDII